MVIQKPRGRVDSGMRCRLPDLFKVKAQAGNSGLLSRAVAVPALGSPLAAADFDGPFVGEATTSKASAVA